MAEGLSFEQIRDQYFINPKNGNIGGMGDGLKLGVEALAKGRALEDPEGLLADTSLGPVVTEMVDDFSRARRFNHLSVAQLHPYGNMPATLAHSFSTLMNNNTIVEEVAPVEVPYERSSIAWMNKNIAGFDPESSSGSLTSGGTLANITALLLARTRLEDEGWDGRTPVTILANEMAHYSIKKAAMLLFPRGMADVEPVPLRADTLKMDTDRLNVAVKRHRLARQPILSIVGVAGETETGLVEDLETIAEIASENGIFYHADGAYGAPFMLSKRADLFRGLSAADTITCDPHKYLYTPYNVGALLIREVDLHRRIGEMNADGNEYMHNKDGYNPGSVRIEGSMGGQGAAALMWTIKTLGASGLGLIQNHALDMTEVFAERIEEQGVFRNVFSPELNTACVIPRNYEPHANERLATRAHDPNFKQVEARLEEDGIYLSTTKFPIIDPETSVLSDRRVFRFVATNPHTDRRDVEDIADMLGEQWQGVLNRQEEAA